MRPSWISFLPLLGLPLVAAPPPELRPVAGRVACYEVLEFEVAGVGEHADPFDPAVVDVELCVRSGDREWRVPGFLAQEYERGRYGGRDWFHPRGLPGWKARFAAVMAGEHEAVVRVRDGVGERTSPPVRFAVGPAERPGFLRVSTQDPRWLETSDGRPFFPIGQNLAFIGSQQYVTLSRADEILGKLGANGANYVRVWTGGEDWALAIEARKSAWGRSWGGRTPVVPRPDEPARRCVLLTNAVTEVQPSHEVGLLPDTVYALAGRVWSEAGAAVRIEVQGGGIEIAPVGRSGGWTGFRHEFRSGTEERWLRGLRLRREGTGRAWLADLSLRLAVGGPELLWEADVNRPVRGWYNPLDSYWLDELLHSARRQGVYVQLCLLTRDLYMSALRDPASAAYDRAIADAKKTFRYAVARWGAFASVGAWEYWNEMDPGLPTDRFYTELGEFLKRMDPWRHLRTTSTWGPSPKDCRHPELDVADVHFYLRPADQDRLRDEVEGILDRARWLREHAPAKPAHQGESGLADDQWRLTGEMRRSRETVDFHNMLWASALSGTTGTALPWWWERLDERAIYDHYRPLARFLDDVPWNGGKVTPLTTEAADGAVRVVALRTDGSIWAWVFHRAAAWRQVVTGGRIPGPVRGASVVFEGFGEGDYAGAWRDTRTGSDLATARARATGGRLVVPVPEFTHDIALRLGR